MKNCHPKELEAKPEDILIMCKKCGCALIDVDEQRELIWHLHSQLDRIPASIRRFFI